MKLKQIVCDKTDLTLTKEKKVVEYGKVFEVDEARGNEILKATYKGQPVVELVEESKEDKPVKKASKKKEDK